MPASCHKLIRDFLEDWKDPEAIQETIMRLVLADNPQSGRLRRMAGIRYGSLADPSNQAAFLSDCVQDLLDRRDALLQRTHINITFLIALFRNALIDRMRRDRRESERIQFIDEETDTGETDAIHTGTVVNEEALRILQAAGNELVRIFQSELSPAEQAALCDYLARSHGDKGKTGFLDDVSESARFKRVSRMKQKLADLNRNDRDYQPYKDPEVWRSALMQFQSEICPGLRSGKTNSDTEHST